MDLKNITSYEHFRRVFEKSIPDEFSNKTGFAESLVGRGLFSIIRFFKQGIDLGRLEYLKRKLENEYFAGWLRFCDLKKIDIVNATLPEEEASGQIQDDSGDQGTNVPKPDNYPIICEILNVDYAKQGYENELSSKKAEFQKYLKELQKMQPTLTGDDQEYGQNLIKEVSLYIQCCDLRLNSNRDVFTPLSQYATANGVTFDDQKATIIIDLLKKVNEFLTNDIVKKCTTYHLTENEKKIIDVLNTCNPDTIKAECANIIKLLEKLSYNGYKMINEEFVSSAINTKVPIHQMLGDVLNTGPTSQKVNPYDYLESIGVTSTDQINFKKCYTDIWRKHPEFRQQVGELVSLEGVRKIQYAAARIIYRFKKTPTYTGITPEKGGGVDKKEDSALRTAWERKVEKSKGEWIYFIDLDKYKLDPFKAMNLQDAIRDDNKEGNDFVKSMNDTSDAAGDTASADKLGLIPVKTTPYVNENQLVVIQTQFTNGALAYLVCSLHNIPGTSGPPSVYRYLGNIDVHKIVEEKIYEKPDFKTKLAQQYAVSIYNSDYFRKGCSRSLNDVVAIDFKQEGDFYINGIYFGSTNYQRYNTVGTPSTQKTHFLQLYVDKKTLATPAVFGDVKNISDPSNIKIFYSENGMRKEMPQTSFGDMKSDTHLIAWKIGQLFQFESEDWKAAYFPDKDKMETGIKMPKSILESLYSKFLIFNKK